MQSQDMTDLRQIEWIKQRLQTALNTLEEIGDSSEYQALKALIVKKTGGQELEDLIDDANRFSEGVDDLEAQAKRKE